MVGWAAVRRLFRILLHGLTVLSLLLCLASAGLWVRSYWRQDVLGWAGTSRPDAERFFFQIVSGGGGVGVWLGLHSPAYALAARAGGWFAHSFNPRPVPYAGGWPRRRFGFDYDTFRSAYVRWAGVVFPAWAAATFFALLPASRLAMAIRRRRRKREGHCKHCGYDLRATPDRCPECGKPGAHVARGEAAPIRSNPLTAPRAQRAHRPTAQVSILATARLPRQNPPMHRLIALIALAFFLPHLCQAAPPQDISDTLAPIIQKHQLPAMAAAVVDADQTLMLGAAGVRKTGSPDKVTPKDLFHIGSCTKAMTATLCAILVEEGKLKWDSTPAQVWPNLKAKFHPDFANVTLKQFLQHRSGLASDTAPEEIHRAMRQFRGTPQAARLKLVELALSKPPATPLNSKYVYTNTAYAIAGAMCEKVTNKPYETLITERLFKPLGMITAGFGPPGVPNRINQPRGHQKSGQPLEPGPNADNPEPYNPSGRAHMSIEDWGKFVSLHLKGAKSDTPLLKKESFTILHTPFEGEGTPYAMGWIVAQRPWAAGPALSHSGTNTFWYCVTWAAPNKSFAVLITCNSGKEGADKACDEAASTLIQKYLQTKAQ